MFSIEISYIFFLPECPLNLHTLSLGEFWLSAPSPHVFCSAHAWEGPVALGTIIDIVSHWLFQSPFVVVNRWSRVQPTPEYISAYRTLNLIFLSFETPKTIPRNEILDRLYAGSIVFEHGYGHSDYRTHGKSKKSILRVRMGCERKAP